MPSEPWVPPVAWGRERADPPATPYARDVIDGRAVVRKPVELR